MSVAGDRIVAAPVRSDLVLPSFIEGDGPALVMLGGGTGGAVALAPHAQALAAEHTVVRLQTLNVDRAWKHEPFPDQYSIKLESAAMVNALDALGITSAVDLLGWSYGGLVALDFALDRPERVRTLTLFEPPAYWVVPLEELQTIPSIGSVYQMGKTMDVSGEPTDDQLVQFLDAVGITGIKIASPGESGWRDWVARRTALKCLPAISAHTDRLERPKNFSRAVLIMTGLDTVPFHRRISQILADTFPLVHRLELPGGHDAPLTARDQFVTHLRAFLDAQRGTDDGRTPEAARVKHLTNQELEDGLQTIALSPKDDGTLRMIVRRPQVGEREVLHEGELDLHKGLVGDTWNVRESSRTPDGSPHPDTQLNIMNARAIALIAQDEHRWPLAGDQLFVDFDLSAENVPPGTRLAIGTAIIEVTDQPHTGCQKFVKRFGLDAMKFVNSPTGRRMQLRGINARVLHPGVIRTGDIVRKRNA